MRYAEAGLIDPDGPQAALVGYPKVDCLVDGSLDRAAIQRRSASTPACRPCCTRQPGRRTPRCIDRGRRSSRALARLGVNVIVKLHDRSFDHGDRASGGIDWRALPRARSCREPARPRRAGRRRLAVSVRRRRCSSPITARSDSSSCCSTGRSSSSTVRSSSRRRVSAADKVSPAAERGARWLPTLPEWSQRSADELANPERLSSERARSRPSCSTARAARPTRAVNCFYDLLALPRARRVADGDRLTRIEIDSGFFQL